MIQIANTEDSSCIPQNDFVNACCSGDSEAIASLNYFVLEGRFCAVINGIMNSFRSGKSLCYWWDHYFIFVLKNDCVFSGKVISTGHGTHHMTRMKLENCLVRATSEAELELPEAELNGCWSQSERYRSPVIFTDDDACQLAIQVYENCRAVRRLPAAPLCVRCAAGPTLFLEFPRTDIVLIVILRSLSFLSRGNGRS